MPSKVNTDHSYQVTQRFLFAVDQILGDRSKGKVTQQSVGETLGISSSNINRLRTNPDRHVTLEACCRLCKFYNFSAYWLLMGRGEMKFDDQLPTQDNLLISKVAELKRVTSDIESALKINAKNKKRR